MIELLLAFTLWPWVLTLALVGGLMISAATETTFVAFIALIIYAAVARFVFDVTPFTWIIENPGGTLIAAALYVCVGIAWSLFKWRDHLVNPEMQRKLTRGHQEHLAKGGRSEDFRESQYFPSEAEASSHKTRIINWIALWPFSAFMFVFYDLLSRFFSRIYEALAGTYDRLTDRYTP
tara:strand:+ start:1629 stop:2162 length:534 start_codon:yes stop_codon:yes gene_type:complete